MKTPLHDAVEAYIEKDRARFHMPGHKGIGEAGLRWDITEVDGCDSLFHAQGPLLELEEEFARIYGAKRSLLCAGGATLCIQTMLALACGVGKKVIMSRNIHRAAINAMTLLDLTPVWIYPEEDAGEWFLGRYRPEAVEAALAANPDAAAVYVTSPDYFGVISDLDGIAAVCKRHERPLLVDNAHGAHLKFLPERYGQLHPIDCGAAICCDSLHKTMPAMTGGALLHLNESCYLEAAKARMSLFGSTSPSYPILLSCERAAAYAQEGAKEGFERTAHAFDRLRWRCLSKGLALPKGPGDPAKLAAAFGALGLSAAEFGAHLRGFGVEPEYLSGTTCVLMGTGFNRAADFARAEAAITALAGGAGAAAPALALPKPQQRLSVRAATFSTYERIPVEKAAGRIAATESSPCPPGIPVVMPGEELDQATIDALRRFGVELVNVIF